MTNRKRRRRALVALGLVRGVLYIIAIPLAPVLYADHFLALVVLRPSKEVLVAAGFALRQGEIGVVELVAAAVPLSVLGVWLFFFLGRSYASEIRGNRLGGVAGRLLRSDKINDAAKTLKKKGDRLIALGRLAFLPSTALAAAAGTIRMPTARFLRADGIGALLSFAASVGAGYALGEAYEQAGLWLTVLAALALLALALAGGLYLKRS